MASTGLPGRGANHAASSSFVARSFRHSFPLLPSPIYGVSHPIYGLDLSGDGAHSIILHSSRELNRKDAFERLSVGLALIGIYFGSGLNERAPGAIGGYSVSPSEEEFREQIYSDAIMKTVSQLERANAPYQIQARFTLSRGMAIISDPETAIIEFFKVIELYIKQLAWTGVLGHVACKKVLEDKAIFSKPVREALTVEANLTKETVDLIFNMKEIRNRFIGHGGMRPTLGELFGDPENYQRLLDQAAFKYDPYLTYGQDFFERVLNDVTLLAGFLFSKMQGIEPLIFMRPGCWYQGSEHVRKVLESEGVQWVSYDVSAFEPG